MARTYLKRALKELRAKRTLALIVLLVIATAGVMAYMSSRPATNTEATVVPAQKSETPAPAKIENKADVQKTGDSLDSEQIDQDLDPSQLDSDINALQQ